MICQKEMVKMFIGEPRLLLEDHVKADLKLMHFLYNASAVADAKGNKLPQTGLAGHQAT